MLSAEQFIQNLASSGREGIRKRRWIKPDTDEIGCC